MNPVLGILAALALASPAALWAEDACVQSQAQAAPGAALAQVTTAGDASYRLRFITDLASQGFRCCADPVPQPAPAHEACRARTSAARGTICVGRIADYPQPVALVIPPHYRPASPTDLALYLRGNNYEQENISTYLAGRAVAEGFVRSERNAIMVIPDTTGHTKDWTHDYDATLTDPTKFESFVGGVGTALNRGNVAPDSAIGHIALVAHSGGYRASSAIVGQSGEQARKISEFYCLDCMYARSEKFAAFARATADPAHRMWVAVTESGGTVNESASLQQQLEDAGLEPGGCALPGRKGARATPCGAAAHAPDPGAPEVAAHNLGFIYTSKSHTQASTDYLARFLQPLPGYARSR